MMKTAFRLYASLRSLLTLAFTPTTPRTGLKVILHNSLVISNISSGPFTNLIHRTLSPARTNIKKYFVISALICLGSFHEGNAQTPPTAGFTITDLKPATSFVDDFLISIQSTATGNPTSTAYYIQPPTYPVGLWAYLSNNVNPVDIPLNSLQLNQGHGDYRIWQIVSNGSGADTASVMYTLSCATMITPVIITVNTTWNVSSITGQAYIHGTVSSNDNSQGADVFITDPLGNTTTYPQQFYGSMYATIPGNYQICAQIWDGTCTQNHPSTCDSSIYVPCIAIPQSSFSFSATSSSGQQIQFSNTSLANTDSTAVNWYWTFGDGNTSNAVAPSHTYASPGNYQVCLITTNDCGADTICDMINTTLLSAKEALGAHLLVSPNPASEKTIVQLEYFPVGRVHLKLFDQVGKLAWEDKIDYEGGKQEIPIDLSEHRNGVYLLRVSGDGYRLVRKIIRMEY